MRPIRGSSIEVPLMARRRIVAASSLNLTELIGLLVVRGLTISEREPREWLVDAEMDSRDPEAASYGN